MLNKDDILYGRNGEDLWQIVYVISTNKADGTMNLIAFEVFESHSIYAVSNLEFECG